MLDTHNAALDAAALVVRSHKVTALAVAGYDQAIGELKAHAERLRAQATAVDELVRDLETERDAKKALNVRLARAIPDVMIPDGSTNIQVDPLPAFLRSKAPEVDADARGAA